jgi:hypothetical protein
MAAIANAGSVTEQGTGEKNALLIGNSKSPGSKTPGLCRYRAE